MTTQNKPRHFFRGRGGGGGLVYQKTGIIFRVEEFRTTPSIQQCFECRGFGHKAPNCAKNQECVVCSEAHLHKNCPNKEKRKPKCANCRGPHVANYRGCPAYKDQAFRQHVVQKQVSYVSILKQALPPPPTTHSISQPNKLYPWSQMWQYKSLSHSCVPKTCLQNKYRQNSICQSRSQKLRKKCLGVNIEGKDVFEFIISQPAPPPPVHFVFSSTLVESSSQSFYGLKQGHTTISYIIQLHQVLKSS